MGIIEGLFGNLPDHIAGFGQFVLSWFDGMVGGFIYNMAVIFIMVFAVKLVIFLGWAIFYHVVINGKSVTSAEWREEWWENNPDTVFPNGWLGWFAMLFAELFIGTHGLLGALRTFAVIMQYVLGFLTMTFGAMAIMWNDDYIARASVNFVRAYARNFDGSYRKIKENLNKKLNAILNRKNKEMAEAFNEWEATERRLKKVMDALITGKEYNASASQVLAELQSIIKPEHYTGRVKKINQFRQKVNSNAVPEGFEQDAD